MGCKFPYLFHSEERIVRIVFSPKQINEKTNALKANFIHFRLNNKTCKNELSSSRIELEKLEFLRRFGKLTEDPNNKRNFYGFACTSVKQIRNLDYIIKFTPNTFEEIKNLFHTDILDTYNIAVGNPGEAEKAGTNLRNDDFMEIWNSYKDSTSLSKEKLLAS